MFGGAKTAVCCPDHGTGWRKQSWCGKGSRLPAGSHCQSNDWCASNKCTKNYCQGGSSMPQYQMKAVVDESTMLPWDSPIFA